MLFVKYILFVYYFLPTSIRLLNAKSGRGKVSRRMGPGGDTMGRTTFLTTLHYIFHLALLMSLCYVNIYHKNFLYGGLLKVIVLYRTVPYRTVPYRTVPYRTVPYRTVPYRTVPYRTVPYRTVPYRTVPYLQLQCFAKKYII